MVAYIEISIEEGRRAAKGSDPPIEIGGSVRGEVRQPAPIAIERAVVEIMFAFVSTTHVRALAGVERVPRSDGEASTKRSSRRGRD
jgi:hypothetical protein